MERYNREKFEKIAPRTRTLLFLLLVAVILSGLMLPYLVRVESLNRIVLSRDYVAGELADEDVYAPYSLTFVDDYATEEAREKARRDVLPIFTYSLSQTYRVKARCMELIEALKTGSAATYDFLISNNLKDFTLYTIYDSLSEKEKKQSLLLVKDCVDYLIGVGVYRSSDILQISSEGYTQATCHLPSMSDYSDSTRVLSVASLLREDSLYESFLVWLDSYSLDFSSSMLQFIYLASETVMESNMYYDVVETERIRDLAAADVETITHRIEEGQIIISKDTIVTEQALRTIERINSSNGGIDYVSIFGQLIFFTVTTIAALYYFFSSIDRPYRVVQYCFLFLIGLLLTISSMYFVYRYVDAPFIAQATPFLLVPLLLTNITNKKRYGFTAGILFISYLSFLPDSTIVRFFYMAFVLEISLLFVRFGVTRLDLIYQAFYSAIAAMFVTVIFHFLSNTSYVYLLTEMLTIVLNVFASYMILSVVLPLLEHFMNIPTVFRLHELCLADTPVLQRLRSQAVGTFNHVNNVSDMAYHAAREIGVNSELARVGALYHDIGKGDHPEYFIENQTDRNVHDEMKVTLSAAVIKSHVKSGVEKAKEMGLPQEVIDIIDQHHGNDVISYFYNEARKEAENATVPYTVNEEDFRYNSDIPQTPEAAIVMLADCFEAASRTIKKPTTQRYEKLISSIISGKMSNGQLNDSKLTLTDLEKIKQVFVHDAFGRDHQRIEYNNKD